MTLFRPLHASLLTVHVCLCVVQHVYVLINVPECECDVLGLVYAHVFVI